MSFGYKNTDLIRVVDLVGKQAGHELHRVIGLQVGRPVRDVAITSGVGFVKTITRKTGDLIKDLVGKLSIDVVGCFGPLDKDLTLLGHLRRLFLAHRAAQNISSTQRISSELLGSILHLLLIDHHSVGITTDLFQERVLILHGFDPLFNLDHLVDVIHRTGPVESQEINDVIDFLNAIFATGFDHATRFQLKHPHGLATVEQLQGRFVVQWHIINVKFRCMHPDMPHSILNNGQVFEPEEVHLQQAHLGDGIHITLGNHLALVTPR